MGNRTRWTTRTMVALATALLGASAALAAGQDAKTDATGHDNSAGAAVISRPATPQRPIELRPTTSEAAGDYEVLGTAAITLSKTVGTNLDPNDCAVDETISVPAGTTVQYCYFVTNTGTEVLNFHTLVDDQLGVLFQDFPFVLNVGASAFATVQVQIDDTVTNNATWSAKISNTADPVSTMTVDLNGVSHTWPDDIDVLLVAPSGESLVLMSDAGGSTDVVGVDINIDDAAAVALPDSTVIATGSYRPTNYGLSGTEFPAPAPPSPWGQPAPAGTDTLTSIFGGVASTGTWSLFVADGFNGDGGSITEWCLDIQPAGLTGCNSDGITVGPNAGAGVPYPSELTMTSPADAEATDSATVTALFPDIAVDPASLSGTVLPGESDSQILTISNNGDADLDWNLFEDEALGPAGSTAYAVNAAVDQYTVFDVSAPEVLPNIAAFPGAGGFINAGEWVNGVVYILENNNTLYDVDPDTGVILDTRTTNAPAGGETWSSMALDPTDGTVYVGSTNVTTSGLYTLDLATATATLVGPVTNAPGLIGIAVDGNGDLWGYDLVTDVFLSIDKTTGAGTVIGPIGFNANFGQGLGWDADTDTVYMAAFNADSFAAELRTVDRSTGGTTLVGVLGSTTPGGTNQLGFITFASALPCSGPTDLPWVGVTSNSGTTGVGESSDVLVTFFSAGLPVGVYEGLLCVESNDPDTPVVPVPLTMTVDTMPFLDDFETGDTSRWSATVAN